ncbi:hypothetical protein R1sor_002403 [Riccia sorocarpa]|uniref:Uncharacterized protein n=1 Tax=Riccia sorocarpa TaxID=122646 RepID=A0ABD3H0E2_9MARC
MDWYERLGPARPAIFRNWIMPTEISAEELGTLTASLRADESGNKSSTLKLTLFCKCLYATAKMEAEGNADCVRDEEFHNFYRLLPSIVETFMTDVPWLKSSTQASETLLYALGFLVDLTKFVLASVNASASLRRIGDVTSIMRALCKGFDADMPFHQMHDSVPLPGSVMEAKTRYVSCRSMLSISAACGDSPPGKRRKSVNGGPVNLPALYMCKCAEFGPRSPESNLWIKSLVEYFGRGCPGYDRTVACGFENLKELLPSSYSPDRAHMHVVKHVRCLLDFFLTAELAQRIVRPLENQILQKLLSFTSAEEEVGKTLPVATESSPASPMVCEEVSCATSKPPIHRMLDKAAEWFRFMFHFRRSKRKIEPTPDNFP